MQTVLLSLPRALAAVVVLQLAFGLIQTKWPTNYYSSSDLVGETVSKNWYRYALFRFAPVLIAAILVAVTGPNETGSILVSVSIFGFLHGLVTAIRSVLLSAIRKRLTFRQALVDGSVFVVVIIVAIGGGLVSPYVRQYVPGLDKYVEVLLTGAVAAIAYAYLSKWTQSGAPYLSGQELLGHIPPELRDKTIEAASRHKVDRDLALAVLVTEIRQRPSWFRSTERATKSFSRTHGPFQNLQDSRGTDEESIEKAMQAFAGTALSRKNYGPPRGRLAAEIEKHNASAVFIEACSGAFNEIARDLSPQSGLTGLDGSPALRTIEIKRVRYAWKVTGDLSGDPDRLYASVVDPIQRPCAISWEEGPLGRFRWHVEVSVDDQQIFVGLKDTASPTDTAAPDDSIVVYLG